MKVLVTGASGYIGQNLLPVLAAEGHEVVAMVRKKGRLPGATKVVVCDLSQSDTLNTLPRDIDAVYYLVHSMSGRGDEFDQLEKRIAENFVAWVDTTSATQLIYLSGLVPEGKPSRHLASRRTVEEVLRGSKVSLTTLRTGVVVGSGSASFEIIRDLVEKLPVMVAPKWLSSRCQPIGIDDAIAYLVGVLGNQKAIGRAFEIGGADVMTYEEVLRSLAAMRGLKRRILVIPVLTPRLSSYWLVFITRVNYSLARHLVDGLKNEVIVHDRSIETVVPLQPIGFDEALRRVFVSEGRAPVRACFKDRRVVMSPHSPEKLIDRIWSLGGAQGYLYANWLWALRGRIDKLVGGPGLRSTRPQELKAGEQLDFWRVVLADRENGHLVLKAEMKLPGEAWLEFRVLGRRLVQTATFRPRGLLGRLYWYAAYPLHHFIFQGMARRLAT